MYLVKKGKAYFPFDMKDAEESDKVAQGGVVKATPPRNYKHLKKAMALFKLGWENDPRDLPFEVYRKLVTMKAGYFNTVPTTDTTLYIPESLAFDQMSQTRFNECYEACLDVISKQLELAPDVVQNEINGFY